MANAVMNALDALQGSMAECFLTTEDGRRYNFMQIYKMEVKMDITSKELPILGKTGKGNRSTGWKGTFSGTAHYNQSVLRQMMLQYKNTGKLPAFADRKRRPRQRGGQADGDLLPVPDQRRYSGKV